MPPAPKQTFDYQKQADGTFKMVATATDSTPRSEADLLTEYRGLVLGIKQREEELAEFQAREAALRPIATSIMQGVATRIDDAKKKAAAAHAAAIATADPAAIQKASETLRAVDGLKV